MAGNDSLPKVNVTVPRVIYVVSCTLTSHHTHTAKHLGLYIGSPNTATQGVLSSLGGQAWILPNCPEEHIREAM